MRVSVYLSNVPSSNINQVMEGAADEWLEVDPDCDHDGCSCSISYELPSKKAVCTDCEGCGTVLAPGMRFHAYTAEDLRDWDEEERRHYFKRGGMYDVTCPTCEGKNVIDVIDRSRIRKGSLEEVVLQAWEKAERDRIEFERECEAERRMGA